MLNKFTALKKPMSEFPTLITVFIFTFIFYILVKSSKIDCFGSEMSTNYPYEVSIFGLEIVHNGYQISENCHFYSVNLI